MAGRRTQLLRYGATAGSAAVVDIGLFGLLHWLGMAVAGAAALSFLVASVVNYILTARYVFLASTSLKGYLKFLSAASLGLVINVGVTTLAAGLPGLPALLAKVIGVGTAFFANFALNALFVFRDTPPENPE